LRLFKSLSQFALVPPLEMDRELTRFLSEADHALGRLDGTTSILPNPPSAQTL
jgi:hypothetical protein